jgi:hypothetical protein
MRREKLREKGRKKIINFLERKKRCRTRPIKVRSDMVMTISVREEGCTINVPKVGECQ